MSLGVASFLASTRDWLLAAFSRENETEADELVSHCLILLSLFGFLFSVASYTISRVANLRQWRAMIQ